MSLATRHLDNDHIVFSQYTGEMKPGVSARHYKVIVLLDQVVSKTAGGIQIPTESLERAENGQTEGVLVSKGGQAFVDWTDPPEVGERVVFSKYAGQTLIGEDGLKYRIMNDNDIGGVRGR